MKKPTQIIIKYQDIKNICVLPWDADISLIFMAFIAQLRGVGFTEKVIRKEINELYNEYKLS